MYDPSQGCGEFGRLPADMFEETFARLIKSDIDDAQLNLKRLPESEMRGLSPDTWQRFHCGWLNNWINTKNRAEWICGTRELGDDGKPKPLPPPSRRIIIPTPDMTHFNAVVPPSDRKPGDSKWCKVHAGAKSLFYDPNTLKGTDIVALLEGEIDGMSIWQCSGSHFPFVSILGRNMWRKVFLPQLKDRLKGKKFILLFDKDDGQIDSVNLCNTLINMGIPAVSKYFFDFLSDADKEFFGQKVDANKILVERGNYFLQNITQNIFDVANEELKSIEEKIANSNLFALAAPAVDNAPKSRPADNNNPNLSAGIDLDDKDKIPEILSHIPANKLDRNDWIAVGMVLKRYGLPFDLFNNWSSVNDSRYNPKACAADWKSFWDNSQYKDDASGHTVATLIHIAKRFGYVPRGNAHNNSQPAPDLPPEVVDWQNENGLINPDTLAKINAAAERIAACDNFPAAVKDTTTLKYLGAFWYYSFLSHVTDKFIADVKKLKLDVNAKKKNFDADKRNEELFVQARGESERARIAALAPSDAELSILDLSINALTNEISKYKTAAGRAHRVFLKQCEADALAAKYNAEREEYEKAPPSTQGEVPDCPVDLILPLGVYFDENNGIRIVDFDKPPGKNGRPVIEAAQTLVIPVQSFREVVEDGQEPKLGKHFKIAIKDGLHWTFAIVDARTLTDPRAVYSLAKYGALITSPVFFTKAMSKLIALNERNQRLKTIRLFSQPGWHGGEFIYPTGGDDYIVRNGTFDYRAAYSPHGDRDEWLKMFKRFLFHAPKTYRHDDVIVKNANGTESHFNRLNYPGNFSDAPNPVAALIFGIAAAAPLCHILNIRNPQLMLGFDSGHGKTAAAKFAASFFSNTDYSVPTLNSTQNFLEDLAVKNNDFPIAVDELQAVNKLKRENMDDFVYNFSMGTTRGRADLQGNAKPVWKYRSARIFTGEESIINDSSGQGALARIFEIKKPYLLADPFAVELHEFVNNHYALFGREFTTVFIPDHREQIKLFYEKIKTSLAASYDMLASHCSIVAAALTGLRFALEFLGFADALKIVIDTLDVAEDILKDAPSKLDSSNKARALPALLNFVDAHPKNFAQEYYSESGTHGISQPEGNEVYGIKLKDGRIAFNPLCLKKILSNELNLPSARQIIAAFGIAGYFEAGEAKGKKYQKNLSFELTGIIGKKSWYYILKSPEVLEEIIQRERQGKSAA